VLKMVCYYLRAQR